jgi:hypothetical protein
MSYLYRPIYRGIATFELSGYREGVRAAPPDVRKKRRPGMLSGIICPLDFHMRGNA